jgi:hypothetical protein
MDRRECLSCLVLDQSCEGSSPPRRIASQQPNALLPQRRRNAKQSWGQFSFFASLREELQCRGLVELSFHQGFIGPLDLNAKFLELAVKRGSCETQDVSAFFYVAGGAFEGLSDRFTLNLLHRH